MYNRLVHTQEHEHELDIRDRVKHLDENVIIILVKELEHVAHTYISNPNLALWVEEVNVNALDVVIRRPVAPRLRSWINE